MNGLPTLQSHGAPQGRTSVDIRALGPWFQNLHLPNGETTAPDHPLGDYPAYKWQALAPHFAESLRGVRVLDIGCNAGFFTFEFARRGATVLAIDHDEHYLCQARWAAKQMHLSGEVEFRRQDVYGLATMREQFDVVIFLGVFYHLRHPLLGLDLAARACKGRLLFQSLAMEAPEGDGPKHDPGYLGRGHLDESTWPKMAFIETELAGDASNWWVPNPAAIDAMLRSCGFSVSARAGDIRIATRGATAPVADGRTTKTLAALQAECAAVP